jgi:hypothetical protein
MSVIVTVPVPLCKSVMSASKLTKEKWERERERGELYEVLRVGDREIEEQRERDRTPQW